MALPINFGGLAAGNQPLSLLDTQFAAVAAMGITACTAAGTNAITLTPNANQATISAYANYQMFSFVPAATPSGAVTIQVNALAALPCYQADGSTQASTGAWTSIQLVLVAYNSALNGGGGGFIIISSLGTSTGSQTGGNRNKLINGAMNVWQRNTSYTLTTSIAYGCADRWAMAMATSAAGTAAQNSSVPSNLGFQFSLRVGRNNGSALTNAISIYQNIITANAIMLQGQTVTLSFYAKAGANYSASGSTLNAQLFSGTGTDQATTSIGAWTGQATQINQTPTLTTSWQRFSYSVTLPSTETQLLVQFSYTPTGTAGADDNFYITGVQLEPGSSATPFEYRLFSLELELAQAYYEKSFAYATAPAQSAGTVGITSFGQMVGATTAMTAMGSVNYKTTKRAASGTITTYNPSAANAQVRNLSTGADCSAVATGSVGDTGFTIGATSAGGSAAGNQLGFHWTGDYEI